MWAERLTRHIRIRRSGDYRRMPWKNGGGETREIAVSPADASLDTLDWRISLATVASDGPFSVFSGVTRTLSVIQGAGITLQVGDAPRRTLLPTSEPWTFEGETPTSATLVDGPIVDLNVMSRRGRYRHNVRQMTLQGTSDLTTVADSTVIFCRAGTLLCMSGTASGDLHSEDCAIIDGQNEFVQLIAAQPAEIHVIELYLELTRSRS